MPERKTVGQLMEEMRLKAGAQNYHAEIPAAAAGGPALVSSATPAKSVERRR